MPTFLTGDFNSPSHLDWTAGGLGCPAGGPLPRRLAGQPAPSPMPASATRIARSIPIRSPCPGFTWTPGGPESDPHEVHDRIDWVLASGPATAVDSTVVGEAGGPDVGIGVSTLADRPPRRRLDVRGHAGRSRPVRGGRRRGACSRATRSMSATGPAPGPGSASRSSRPARVPRRPSASRAVGPPASRDGTATFPTAALAPGAYDAILVAGGAVVSRSPFWLYPAGTPTTVRTNEELVRRRRADRGELAGGARVPLGLARHLLARRFGREPAQRGLQRRLLEQRPVPALHLHEDRDRGLGASSTPARSREPRRGRSSPAPTRSASSSTTATARSPPPRTSRSSSRSWASHLAV